MNPPTTILTSSGLTPEAKATLIEDAESIGQELIGDVVADVEALTLSQPIHNKIEIPGVGDSIPIGFTAPFTNTRYSGSLEVTSENGKVFLKIDATPQTS